MDRVKNGNWYERFQELQHFPNILRVKSNRPYLKGVIVWTHTSEPAIWPQFRNTHRQLRPLLVSSMGATTQLVLNRRQKRSKRFSHSIYPVRWDEIRIISIFKKLKRTSRYTQKLHNFWFWHSLFFIDSEMSSRLWKSHFRFSRTNLISRNSGA